MIGDIAATALEWGPEGETHFVALDGISIAVIAFDATNESMAIERILSTGTASISSVALADEYIVGGSNDKKLHVWDRSTGERLHWDLCDAHYQGEDELDEDEIIYPLGLCCQGHIFVSTSHLGCAVCVWNLRTGRILKVHNDGYAESVVSLLPDGADCTSMAYLPSLNGYCLVDGFMCIWTFPTCDEQLERARNIREREESIRSANQRNNQRQSQREKCTVS